MINDELVSYGYVQNTSKELKMPLIKNAKPGSKGFRQNIVTEERLGNKPPKQAVAIAYDEYAKTKPMHTKGIKSRHKNHSDA